jgi:hypothetical protein
MISSLRIVRLEGEVAVIVTLSHVKSQLPVAFVPSHNEHAILKRISAHALFLFPPLSEARSPYRRSRIASFDPP